MAFITSSLVFNFFYKLFQSRALSPTQSRCWGHRREAGGL